MSKKLIELIILSASKAKIVTTKLEISGIDYCMKFVNTFPQNTVIPDIEILVEEGQQELAKLIIDGLDAELKGDVQTIVDYSAFKGVFVVPVDFSNASINVCYYALELASIFHSRIKLIHTYGIPELRPMSFDDTDFYTGAIAIQLEELRREADRKINELLVKLQNYCLRKSINEVAIAYSIVNGVTDEVTLYSAEEEAASLLLMGVSRKDIRTFEQIGKTASRIIDKAKCPVLIIPEDSNFNGIQSFNNVLYTTAFDEMDFAAIHKLIGFIKKLNSNIYILHISNEEGDPWDNIKMDGLRDYFANAYNYNSVHCNLLFSKDILQPLTDFIDSNSINLITMVTHKRGLIWKLISPSITKKVLYHTKIPLLVFHS